MQVHDHGHINTLYEFQAACWFPQISPKTLNVLLNPEGFQLLDSKSGFENAQLNSWRSNYEEWFVILMGLKSSPSID